MAVVNRKPRNPSLRFQSFISNKDVSKKKPWKRPASKPESEEDLPDSDEDGKTDTDDSGAEEEKTE